MEAGVHKDAGCPARLRRHRVDRSLLSGAMLLLAIFALASVTAAPSTGIVVHGFHCNAPRWEEVVWGDEAAQRLGRLPHAALLAWQARHELQAFICGSGASQTASGSAEADALISLLFERLPSLLSFDAFRGVDLEALEALLRRTVIADTESLNTQQEVLAALARLSRLGVQRALLVSSPTHMPRCLRDASVAAARLGYEVRAALSGPRPCQRTRTHLSPRAPFSPPPAARPGPRRQLSWSSRPTGRTEAPPRRSSAWVPSTTVAASSPGLSAHHATLPPAVPQFAAPLPSPSEPPRPRAGGGRLSSSPRSSGCSHPLKIGNRVLCDLCVSLYVQANCKVAAATGEGRGERCVASGADW